MMNLPWFLSGHHHGSHEGASSHGRSQSVASMEQIALGFGAGPLLCMAHMEGPMDIWVIAGGESFSIEDATEDADGFQLTGIDGRRLCSLTCGPQVPESPCFAGYPHYPHLRCGPKCVWCMGQMVPAAVAVLPAGSRRRFRSANLRQPFPAGTPLLDDLAIRHPPEMERLPLDVPAGCGIGATPRLVRREEIAFGNDGVDRHLHIGKDRVEIDEGLLDPGWAGELAGGRAMIDELRGKQLVDEGWVVSVYRILKDPPDKSFIRVGG